MTQINKLIIIISVVLISSCSYDDGFRVEGDKVVYERPWNTGHGTQIIKVNADAKTFEILGGNNMIWARDKSYIFNEHHILDFLDRDTFQVLNDYFGKDDKTVVCGIKPIPEADATSFRVKKFIDETGKKVELGIDKNAAYTCSDNGYRHLASTSIDDFRPIQEGFYRDKTKVWWNSIELIGANPNTFKALGGGYATDDLKVYYLGRQILEADATTFKITGVDHAKDKNHKYRFENRVE